MSRPSVDAAAHARPVGENRTHFVRAFLPEAANGHVPGPPDWRPED